MESQRQRGSKKALLWIVMASLVLALTACGGASGKEGKKRVVKIGYLPITHAVPLYVEDSLEEQGYENFELELVKFGSWPDLADALNTGRIDGASMLVTLAMRAKEQGIDLKAVALGHRDGNVLVVAPDINQVSDLQGKNFAIPHKFSTHNILLYQMLEQAGMKYEDVNAIETAPAEMPAALSEGRIAGYVVAEPFGAIAVDMGKGKVLYQSDEIWQDSVDCALVLRGEFINKERAVAAEFVKNYLIGGERAELKDDYTKEVSTKYMQVDQNVLDLSLQWIKYDDLKLNQEPYEKLAEYLVKMGLSENPPTYEQFVDNSFIDEAK